MQFLNDWYCDSAILAEQSDETKAETQTRIAEAEALDRPRPI